MLPDARTDDPAVCEGDLLWTPSPARRAEAPLTQYVRWLEARGRRFDSYQALWQWSVSDLEGFWQSILTYFGVQLSAPAARVLGRRSMPGAEWFPGARINYAEQVLRHERDDTDALCYTTEGKEVTALSWAELGGQVRRLGTWLRGIGVRPGDRVVAYLPNGPEAVIALLATASVGAIWASCGPDFRPRGVLDRFQQLTPKVGFFVDGYEYAGRTVDRRADLEHIISGLPSLQHAVVLRRLFTEPYRWGLDWDEAVGGPAVRQTEFQFEQVSFSDPLWILFSSGTTGLPKPIMHGHGGIVLEHMKALALNMDLRARDRMLVYTGTGWMMWNMLVSALLLDAVPLLYDGSPSYPHPDMLWGLAACFRANLVGTSPSYVAAVRRSGLIPRERYSLEHLRTVLLAGAPVTPECMSWVYQNVREDAWIHSGSGGTDVCSGILGGVVTLPVYAGEIQHRMLGMAAYAFNAQGEAVVDELGELVITEPAPSMPIGFWNDPDGSRYRETYFEQYPGVWRHGDFVRINQRGGCFVLGRSDATLNRHGVRIGTAEIYRALEEVEEIEDALIVNLDLRGGHFFMPLFVKLRPGFSLDEPLVRNIQQCMRRNYSARHVPDKIYQVPNIPYTLTGKKMEVPVRRLLMGVPMEKAVSHAATSNSDALEWFVRYALEQQDYERKSGRDEPRAS